MKFWRPGITGKLFIAILATCIGGGILLVKKGGQAMQAWADQSALAGQNLGTINTSLAEAQAQRIRAQARWSQLQANDSLPQDLMAASLVPALRSRPHSA